MKKRALSALLACVMLLAAGCSAAGTGTAPAGPAAAPSAGETAPSPAPEPSAEVSPEPSPALPAGHNTMTGDDLMNAMKLGWNLGNTFDAHEGETAWGNPPTTREMIVKIKELGFDTIRIPISWHKHVGPAPDYTIDEKWMARVETVVGWALDAGLYVIVNSHHDNGIYYPAPDNAEAGKTYLTAIWTQIGERFADAPYELIFQTMNEPRIEGAAYEWNVDTRNADCMAAVETINQLNQAALDAMRATGGNNVDRFVIVSSYAGSPTGSLNNTFQMPEDSAEGKLILSVHAYTPYELALNVNSPKSTFDRGAEGDIRNQIRSVHYKFSKLGVPIIIDEMGCIDKDNPEDRYAWGKAYISIAREYGIPCVWWDNGHVADDGGERFGLFDRRNLEVYPQSQRAYEGLLAGLESGT